MVSKIKSGVSKKNEEVDRIIDTVIDKRIFQAWPLILLKTVQMKKELLKAYLSLGKAYNQIGRDKKAIENFIKANELIKEIEF